MRGRPPAGPWEASRGFLPTITADAQALRSTDPVAVFGMKLRQGDFAAADLALSALNQPAPYTDYTARLSVEQPLLNLEGWYGHAAARRASAAQAAVGRRAAGATILAVTQAYWDTQLATGRAAALDTGLMAARAHAAQAEALHAQGLVSGLDARLARLAAARLDAQRVAADADAENALAALRVVLALPDTMVLRLVDPLAALPADSAPPRPPSAPAAIWTHSTRGFGPPTWRAPRLGGEPALARPVRESGPPQPYRSREYRQRGLDCRARASVAAVRRFVGRRCDCARPGRAGCHGSAP